MPEVIVSNRQLKACPQADGLLAVSNGLGHIRKTGGSS
jgi:hypothetical protein